MNDEVKPCPFCGNEKNIELSGVSIPDWIKIECMECGFKIGGYAANERDKLITRWNRRPIEDKLRAQLASGDLILRNLLEGLEVQHIDDLIEKMEPTSAKLLGYTITQTIKERLFAKDAAIRELVDALTSVRERLSWHYDEEADPDNTSPTDMIAHVNGLCIKEIDKALALSAGKE
jgi:Lar family restriction alleviation protein